MLKNALNETEWHPFSESYPDGNQHRNFLMSLFQKAMWRCPPQA
jgi:hypothetical protein